MKEISFKLLSLIWMDDILITFREYEGGAGEAERDKDKPMTEAERRQSLFPGKKVEKWERPLEDKTVQQQVDKICEWKCVYSRPNAKIRWYKDKKEIFSVSLWDFTLYITV